MKRPVSQQDGASSIIDPDGTPSTEMMEWMNLVTNNSYKIITYTPTLDPSSVSANSTDEQTFTVTGLKSSDVVLDVQKPSHTSGIVLGNYRASADDTLAITFGNVTGSPVDPGSEAYKVTILRQ